MELSNKIKLSKYILDAPLNRYCEIYKIVNNANGKLYVGQAVSHILNHNKYRPHGREGRFRCHISEAFSKKKCQSHYLNNAIRKYGTESFTVELIEYCELSDADEREKFYTIQCNSLYPSGYNLKIGGKQFQHTLHSKERVSKGLIQYYENVKLKRFEGIGDIDDDIDKYIRPLNRDGKQYGWYIYINGKKADFGGVHISLEDSKEKAVNFIEILKKEQMATHLDAGNSLELLTTTS